MTPRENRLLWVASVLGIGVGLWLGSWIAIWKPLALFVISYPIMIWGMFMLSNITRR